MSTARVAAQRRSNAAAWRPYGLTSAIKLAQSRRTVVFATGVDHSVHLRNEFRRAGVLAEHLDSSTPVDTRERILKQLSVGEIDVVTNCMILTEGWDQPEVSCIILARPTKSFGLYRQMVGRGLRPAAGKSDLIVIDHAGCVFAHGLPEDPVKWSLREDERVVNAVHAARGQPGHMPRLTDCPECHAVREEGRPCGVCGWRPQPKPRNVDVIDGELVRVQRDRTAPAAMSDLNTRRGFYGELLHIALSRNYAKGWAAYKFRDKFGVLPPWHWNLSVSPKPPSPATLAWVRSRQIAYAKSRQTKPRP